GSPLAVACTRACSPRATRSPLPPRPRSRSTRSSTGSSATSTTPHAGPPAGSTGSARASNSAIDRGIVRRPGSRTLHQLADRSVAALGRRSITPAAAEEEAGMQGRWLVGGIVGAAIATLAQQALGAAFFIQEQSIAGMGRAYGGESRVAATAAKIFFTPAGLTLLDRPQVQGAGYAIIPTASFEDRGTVARTPATFGAFRGVPGKAGGNPYGPTPFGNFYASMPVLEDRVWLGFGVT